MLETDVNRFQRNRTGIATGVGSTAALLIGYLAESGDCDRATTTAETTIARFKSLTDPSAGAVLPVSLAYVRAAITCNDAAAAQARLAQMQADVAALAEAPTYLDRWRPRMQDLEARVRAMPAP
jgi:hypothetical protein